MPTKLEIFNRAQLKKEVPDIRPGDTVRIHQKIEEKGKERVQISEGLVIAKKHGKGVSATITVRKVISGVGVEKIFPVHSPTIEKIEIVKRDKVRRAKLYYLRKAKGERARLKRKGFVEALVEGGPKIAKEKPVEPTEEKKSAEEIKEEPKEEKK
jgi:large subunit ribosomal protein L19